MFSVLIVFYLYHRMCEILHLRHYKLWLRFDTIFNWTNFAKKQEQLLGIIHGLTSKVSHRRFGIK